MTDYDFKEVEFINKNMRYITYNDFVKNHDKIKKCKLWQKKELLAC